MAESAKKDQGKPRLELIVPAFISRVGQVLEFGARKYDPWNWLTSAGTESHEEFRDRCYAAALRHLMAYQAGEKIDPESGLPHLSHAACNLMFMQEYDERTLQYVRGSV